MPGPRPSSAVLPPLRRWRTAALLGALVLLAGCGTSSGAAPAGRAQVVPPPAGGVFDYQIGGAYRPAAGVQVVDRDRSEPPARGAYGVCYVNAFQTQPEDAAAWRSRDPGLLVRHDGRLVEDPDWPGEHLLDTSTAARRRALLAVVGPWVDGCARSGYRAVEPDNLDSWTRSEGALTMAGDLAFARLLADRAHADGLAIAQKNAPELGARGRDEAHLDFAVAEECQHYRECGAYTSVYGDHVVEIEYTDAPRRYFDQACAARGDRVSVLLRDRDVVPAGRPGHHAEWC